MIATPSALHMQQAILALSFGKAVFCQKPLGRNAMEVREVISAARKADLLLGADFSYRYTKAFQAIYEVIQSGELGQIFSADLKFHNAYGPGKPWFYDINQSGGGCVLDLGIHLLDLLLYAIDFPQVTSVHSRLFSKGKLIKAGTETEDYATVNLALDNGAAAHLSCSWNLHAGQPAIIEVTFYGTAGGVSMKNINGSFYDFVAQRFWSTQQELLAEPPDDWGGKALLGWIHQLGRSNRYSQNAEQFYHSAEVLDKIYGRI